MEFELVTILQLLNLPIGKSVKFRSEFENLELNKESVRESEKSL